MKIAYLLMKDIGSNDGIVKKIKSQTDAWKKQGADVAIFCITNDIKDSILDARRYKFFVNRYPFKTIFQPRGLLRDIKNYEPDIIYSRYMLFSIFFFRLLCCYKSFIEINSDDINEYKLMSKYNKRYILIKVYNYLTRKIILSKADSLISVTHELKKSKSFKKYERKIQVVPNSIDKNRYHVLKKKNALDKNDPINIFFIGSPGHPWHGLDKIEQMADKLGDSFFIHIVGTEKNSALTNIKYHGYLDFKDYSKILSKCHVTLATMALHRNGMNEACPLKVREYIATGFPVIIPYQDTAFIGNDVDWICNIPNEESCLTEENIDRIKKFCHKNRDRVVSHDESNRFISTDFIETIRYDLFLKSI